jgi:hypothetical protein
MKAAIYQQDTGQIVKVVTGPDDFCAAQCKSGQGWLDVGDESGNGHYVDNGVLVELPAKPSQNHTFDYATKQWIDPRTTEQISSALQAEIVKSTQNRLDTFAQTRNYDGILSACTYATSSVPTFASEGQYCVTARDSTWAALYVILGEVTSGTRSMPGGYSDIEGELPVLGWPSS